MTKPLRRILVNENDEAIMPVDSLSSSLITIDSGHYEIHEGDSFYNKDFTDLANGASYYIVIKTPDNVKYAHLLFILATEAEATLSLYVAPSLASLGTIMPVFNRNNNSNTANTTLLYHTPTIVNVGTRVARYKTGAGKLSGGEISAANEIVLRRNTLYLAHILNDTTSNNWADWLIEWYENEG